MVDDGNIICRVIDLPRHINAITVVDSDGTFNVYVNARLCPISQREAYDHECRHIIKNHFYKEKPVSECEQEAIEK